MKLPSKLYKYQQLNVQTITNLSNQHLCFSSPKAFNDPFDSMVLDKIFSEGELELLFKAFLSDNLDKKEVIKGSYLTNGKINDNFTRHMQEVYNIGVQANVYKRGIACFSEKKDDILMWAHYSDGHKGICLEFDTKVSPFAAAKKVNYNCELPNMNLVDIMIHKRFDSYMAILLTKHRCWEYEQEWRIFTVESNKHYPYQAEALTSVFFGVEIDNNQIKIVSSILQNQNKNIKMYKMKKHKKEFAVTPELLT